MSRHSKRANVRTSRNRRSSMIGAGVVVTLIVASAVALGLSRGASRSEALSDVESRGRVIYETSCASCHGVAGEGQANWKSARADGSRPAPPHDISGHTWHHPDAVLFGIVREGGRYGAPPGYAATMPGFKTMLTDQQIVEVLSYVKTMWGDKERRYQATMSEAGPFPAEARR